MRDGGTGVLAYCELGREADAQELMQDLRKDTGTYSAYAVARANAYLGESDEAFEWLRKALAGADWDRKWLGEVNTERMFAPLHDDPRWRSIIAELRHES